MNLKSGSASALIGSQAIWFRTKVIDYRALVRAWSWRRAVAGGMRRRDVDARVLPDFDIRLELMYSLRSVSGDFASYTNVQLPIPNMPIFT